MGEQDLNLKSVDSHSEKEGTKSDNLTEQLIDQIVSGSYPAGSKISEPELAKHYGVSRGPLREAMMRLESMGLVERIPHVGARVVALSQEKLIEIYSVREALEGMAARLACEYITDEELIGLEELLDAHHQHIEQVEGVSYFHQQGDFDFHYRVIKASRNTKLISLLCDELYHLLRMYRYQSQRSHSRPEQALKEHFHLLGALKERDAELAEMLMRRHIMRSRLLIEQKLKQDKENVS
ncbi:GntR family transcriptional regulator [Photobacterium lutimaris]|uniref:GntR family transcriptional regulator n=1 Tax=Photobacterium lutimaris TaxID=388278 RepID=A0A2T3J3E7_9GAMM|nr:GntR family transcriptional regulator [Photobacterium lutimaris]PSU35821.1 GntR family transcriptional regulator [Photobacterium lutimaris]TDR78892.1 GntR family transcriptional regulator [Photobacterium lutimaris]